MSLLRAMRRAGAANAGGGGGGGGDVPGPAGALSITFSWDLPLFNADGTPLTPPVSQRVEYSTVSKLPDEAYEYVKIVASGSATSVTITNLAAGTYFGAVRIFDGTNWSELSPEIYPGVVAA